MMLQGNLAEQLFLILICIKAAQWAAAVVAKPGHDLATPAEVRPVDTFQSAWRAQKSVVCGTCIPFDLNHCGPYCAAPAKFWIPDYNLCELFDFNNRGPWGRIFWSNKSKKNYGLSKTFASKSTRLMKSIGIYRNVYNSIFFRVIHV